MQSSIGAAVVLFLDSRTILSTLKRTPASSVVLSRFAEVGAFFVQGLSEVGEHILYF
jgi:hypothetical protein